MSESFWFFGGYLFGYAIGMFVMWNIMAKKIRGLGWGILDKKIRDLEG